MKILVTGAAGFIGFHTVKHLLERGDDVVGFDSVNNYYEPALKEARIKCIDEIASSLNNSFCLIRADLSRILNIGNSKPVELNVYIEAIERALGKKAIKNMLPLQSGDAPDTFADCNKLETLIGYKPVTSIEEGVFNFVEWYKKYYE